MPEKGRRILVVEDEPLLQRLLATALKHKGYRVEVCSSGEEALRKIEELPRFEVMVTDFRMAGMTGLALIRFLQGQAARLGYVLMSSNTLEELGIDARSLGAVEYVRKPFGLSELYQAVDRAIEAARS